MKEEIITKMSKFTITEQAILLITRKDLNEEQMNYLREILNSCEMDWSYFVGSLIYILELYLIQFFLCLS